MMSLLLLILGCRPSLTFQVTRPADVAINQAITALALVDRVEDSRSAELMSSLTAALEVNIIDPPRFTLAARSGSVAAASSLGSLGDGGAIPAETLSAYCERSAANGVVSLRALSVTDDWDFTTREEVVTEQIGNRSVNREVIIHTATHHVDLSAVMRLYDCDGEIVDVFTLRAADAWEAEGDRRGIARTNAGEPEDHISALMITAGERYLRHISPFEATITRAYYRKPDGSKALGARRLEPAEKALLASVKTSDGKNKGKALFNLALVYEQQGRLDDAVKTARRANKLLDNDLSRELLRKLRFRRAQEQVITEQLGDEPAPARP